MDNPTDDSKVLPLNGRRGRKPFTLHRLDAIPERPQRDEVVQGLLAASEIGALVGPPGAGKSAVAALLATTVADGRPFLGRRVLPGPAVFIAAERPKEAQRRLLALALKGRRAPVYFASARPNVSDLSAVQDLGASIIEICDRERSCPSLIVFDTLARCLPADFDENRTRDMGKVVEGLVALAELVPTAAIVVVHHVAKLSGDMRGSSALLAGVDLVLKISGSGQAKKIVVDKANTVAEGQVLGFRLDAKADGDVDTVVVAEPVDLKPSREGRGLSALATGLLAIVEKEPITKVDLLQKARECELVRGSTDATRVAVNRALAELRTTERISTDEAGLLVVQ